MKRTLRLLVCCTALVLLAAACSKKEAEPAAVEGEEALPPAERAEPEPPAAPEPAPAKVAAGPSSVAPAEAFTTEAKAFEDWCKRHALDPDDEKMLDADADGDGFPNREEFVGNSDPRDPKSRPGIHAEMRLKDFHEVTLPVVLDGVQGDKAFLKQVESGDDKPQTVKTGDNVRGMKVGRVVKRRDFDKSGNPIDVSRVTLENPETKERVVLVKGMPARTSATHAVLVSPDGKTTLTVKQGETFEWPGAPGTHYTVVDMSADQVVVQQVDTQKMWTIPRE